MTPEQQRIAIAEACGFIHVRCIPPDHCIGHHPHRPSAVPDYLNDLNAMHEAWCSLTPEQHDKFRNDLAIVVRRDGHICGPCRSLSNATAAQRAEAFLKTLGKWTS